MSSHPSKYRTVAIINEAFRSAPVIHSGFREVIQDTLYDECLAAERQHRKGHPVVRGFTVQDAARYFAVKYLREYLLRTDKIPEVSQYLHLRHECFTAAAIVLEFGDKLDTWVRSIDPEFERIDYARMMQWVYYADRDAALARVRAAIGSTEGDTGGRARG